MKKVLIDDLSEIKKWWSVRIGAIWVILLAAIPAINDQFPNIAPTLLAMFPKHGQQVIPILGVVLMVAARVVSQREIIDRIRRMFHPDAQGGSQ